MLYYIVVTFKKGEAGIPKFKDISLKMFESDLKIHIVQEFGKNGDNPHLNIVCERPRLDNLRTSLIQKYKKVCDHYDPKRAIVIKGVPQRDLSKIIKGYLAKEGVEPLASRGFDNIPDYNQKKTNVSIGDRMLKAMPKCLHKTCHHPDHCWNPESIMSWVYDWCVENKVAAIPLVLKRLIQLALQEKLPEIAPDGCETKETFKEKCISNMRRELFSL